MIPSLVVMMLAADLSAVVVTIRMKALTSRCTDGIMVSWSVQNMDR